jgi:hypothetical protein
MAKRWRHVFYSLVPSWLSSGDGEKVLYTLGRVTDAFVERARQSLTARFPTYVGPTGLRMLGEERGIVQGRGEANPGFARRLREWRGERGHLVRGSAYAMLRQIWHYFGGIKAQEIDTGGNVYTVERDGTESATHGGFWNWDEPPPPVAGFDDLALTPPAHDADAGTDVGSLLFSGGIGTAQSLTLTCDGTPGRLIFLNLSTGIGNTMTPQGDGWDLVAENEVTSGYVHRVYRKIVGPYESFTSVEVVCVNGGLGVSNRAIGRAVNVPGVYRDGDVIVEVETASSLLAAPPTPALAGTIFDVLGLGFFAGRTGTYSAVPGWTEIGAERVAGGPLGIGIDEQYTRVPVGGVPSDTLTTGGMTDPRTSMIFVSVRHKLPQDWFRFWLKLVPSASHGITSWGTWAQDEARGTGTWGDGNNETWGQTGVTPGDARVIENLFKGARPWKMAGTKAEWLIVVLGQDEAHEPDGTWGSWIYEGEPTRYEGWRYWKL